MSYIVVFGFIPLFTEQEAFDWGRWKVCEFDRERHGEREQYTFIAASAYLEDNNKRISAGEVGSSVVQNLQTILEYFDSADVANLKVRMK